MESELNEVENENGIRLENGTSEASLHPVSITSSFNRKPCSSCSGTVKNRAVIICLAIALLCLFSGIGVHFGTKRQGWINIHLVPHSHDDVGWLRTPETYFEHTVKYILNNVVHELEKDPRRKFTYVETYFFWRWWMQQSPEMENRVKKLVASGQFQFAGGGWTMNDEATVNYQCVIDQFTWGLRKLNDTFGPAGRPNIGWQIDTFGHSREMASLLVQMGYNGLFFARIDEDERLQRRDRRSMEFVWDDRDGATSILTSVMYKHYNPPSGYHYEKEINEGANLDGFLEAVREWAKAYQTQNVLVPMGDDFTYYDARAWFDNMDSLIRLAEERKDEVNVNIFYSTPEQYLKAIRDSPAVWPVKYTGDFFPYASDTWTYWSGYYTSRPGLKLFERVSNNILQSMKQLLGMTALDSVAGYSLDALREAMAMLMHHDAITGTSRQEVNDHYMLLLHEAVTSAINQVIKAIGALSVQQHKGNSPLFESCLLLNESTCFVTEHSKQFIVAAYNPLSWAATHVVRVPVHGQNYEVRNFKGDVISSQVVPIPPELMALPGRPNVTSSELVFLAESIPALGFTSFHISVAVLPYSHSASTQVSFGFHQYTGRLNSVTRSGITESLDQDVEFYFGAPFWTGAYIFRPSDPYPYSVGSLTTSRPVADGPVVTETQHTLGPWVSQAIRAYSHTPVIEFEWLVGPIPTEDYHGKEVIIKYSTKINSSSEFHTDTNGRGSLLRRRDKRDDWTYVVHEEVSGNYYPVTSHIKVSDGRRHLTVLTDRAQGGTSMKDGEVELMVHRRLCYDDGKGVNEPLNETAYGKGLVVRGKHWVLLADESAGSEMMVKRMGFELQNPPVLLFAPTEFDYQKWINSYATTYFGLRQPLPQNVRVLTLEPWKESLLLLRLEHMFERTAMGPNSQPVNVQLKDMFSAFEIVAARETKLGADRWKENSDFWLTGDLTVRLEPAAIRTFLVQVVPRQS